MSTSILSRALPVSGTDDHLTALVYGRSGSGKTTLAATFPKKILLLDIRDKGTDSIKDVEGIDVLEINNWEEFETVYWALQNEPHEYQTLVVDTISNLQELAISEVKRKAKMDQDSAMSQRLWGEASRLMQQWVYFYRDLPMHVVFLAQERSRRGTDEESYDDQLDPEVGPALMPSVSKTVCAAVKVIANTYIKQTVKPSQKIPGRMVTTTQYMLRVGPHAYYTTKVRTPRVFRVPTSVPNQGYETLRSLMRGEKVEKEAEING